MEILRYLDRVTSLHKSGHATEHTYRAELANLVEALSPSIKVTNEPRNVTDCGNPDYVVMRGPIPVGYIEAKDVGKDLNSAAYKEQLSRYRKALDNLIITDYLWFQFYRHGELITEIQLARIENGVIVPYAENFELFEDRIRDFCAYVGQTVKSSQRLAQLMAAKARLLQKILQNALESDEKTEENTSLRAQMDAFKAMLIHDISAREFADIYAQSLAYGMFAARLHDPTQDTFSRHEAAHLIPKSNPFLRKLFQYIAGYDIDERIRATVDNLAEVFRATDVKALLANFGVATSKNDPVIHFYETFLSEYDAKLRKARGVWYTPQPVVDFIVRSVDHILKDDFGIGDGLADTQKTIISIPTQVRDRRTKSGYKTAEKEVHRVQILDPAAGTGTFLAEIVKYIYRTRFKNMQGVWSAYVEDDLIPRLNGFELLMASYAMAHLKLDMLLTETGYRSKKEPRFRVFLTNSLEEHHPDTGTLFASWLSTEAQEANHIKRETPVMVVIGNPPYAVSSSNKGSWIQQLIEDYKKGLNEKKLNLDDDYIKFIRYGQHYIEKNGEGVLAYISNNSFLDGVTHRQMRKSLIEAFDKIYIVNLHGSATKKETTPDGGKDENVFDIMQGVSINIFIKTTPRKTSRASVFVYDCYGTRKEKYKKLESNDLSTLAFEPVNLDDHYFFFSSINSASADEYNSWPCVADLFSVTNNGLKTDRDQLFFDFDREELSLRIQSLLSGEYDHSFAKRYNVQNSGSYKIEQVIRGKKFDASHIRICQYRPLDYRYIYYDPDIISRPAYKVMSHMLAGPNVSLVMPRQVSLSEEGGALVCASLSGHKSFSAYNINTVFPLYLYPEEETSQDAIANRRSPNLNVDVANDLLCKLPLELIVDENHCVAEPASKLPCTSIEKRSKQCAPLDAIDYIYAVLHSPYYRDRYKELLKINFPRIPHPSSVTNFWKLVDLGRELRTLHTQTNAKLEELITSYPEVGDNIITRRITKSDWEDTGGGIGRIWINDRQYFNGVPLSAWQVHIGGYQPAQKWLKDRRGRQLGYDEILYYQKLIVSLTETLRCMRDIDEIGLQ